ncbi:MAG TPA: hypothetical protein VGC76_15660 [Pyrinomonadaceae bacterium]|jgi:hypothetical protein
MKDKRFSRLSLIFALIFIFAALCRAQQIEANIKIESSPASFARVEGRVLQKNIGKNWGFLRSIAGIENLGERISDLALTDKDGKTISYKKLIAGEYLAEDAATNFSYKIDLTAPKKYSAMAHVSWLLSEKGLLMLDDLLPQFGPETSAKINFELPPDWTIAGINTSSGKNPVDVENVEKAVFLVGKNLRSKELQIGESQSDKKLPAKKNIPDVSISGEWLFSDAEAAETAGEILGEYENFFGESPSVRPQIFLLKFQPEINFGSWEAETRGASVVILSNDMPFKSQSLQRLHEQLRHELFHLWIPNNLALSGNYDWFYEGFALYQSLRTGVALNRIRFEDFLDTLARAYDLDNMQEQKTSLIDASKNRWGGANSQIYARGLLVAFLTDAALLKESKGKRSVTDVLRAVYEKHKKPNQPQDANEAILNVFAAYTELRPVVERYIKGAEKLDWQTELESLGIETNGENFPLKLTVKAKLTGRQKDLLNELGYNNWRKLSRQSK